MILKTGNQHQFPQKVEQLSGETTAEQQGTAVEHRKGFSSSRPEGLEQEPKGDLHPGWEPGRGLRAWGGTSEPVAQRVKHLPAV